MESEKNPKLISWLQNLLVVEEAKWFPRAAYLDASFPTCSASLNIMEQNTGLPDHVTAAGND